MRAAAAAYFLGPAFLPAPTAPSPFMNTVPAPYRKKIGYAPFATAPGVQYLLPLMVLTTTSNGLCLNLITQPAKLHCWLTPVLVHKGNYDSTKKISRGSPKETEKFFKMMERAC